MHELLTSLVYDVIYILMFMFVGFVIALIKAKWGTEKTKQVTEQLIQIQTELITKQNLAEDAVRLAEQAAKDLGIHGEAKLNYACEWMSDQAEQYGLTVTANEISGLVKSSLRRIKDEFGEEWAGAKEVKK